MRIDDYLSFNGNSDVYGLHFASGSFGIVDENAKYERKEEAGKVFYTFQNEQIKLQSEIEVVDNVFLRRDSLENLSNQPVELRDFTGRFCLDGNEYDVYTQYSAWLHESNGHWQPLQTQIRAESCGMRGCDGAAPIMGFHNRYTGKNIVFHLMPNARWQMTAKKFPQNEKEYVALETGFCNTGLHFSVAPGEKIFLPEIVYFPAESKIDLDAYKLHRYFNRKYPRRKLPVIYNSWMYCFDNIDPDNLLRQADCAAELGIEAFMIDAGWFGVGADWSSSVGDWEENTVSGPKGRLAEISRYVQEKGMIFGLWFEPERATPNSRAVAEHPDYYIPAGGDYVLDFSNPAAVSYMVDIISGQIEKYSIGWVKFDFNTTISVDTSGCGFYRYFQGQKSFIQQIKARFPQLYITNCASGGYRMDLYQAQFTDSFWLSDNQGPLGGLDVLKGTLRRMPGGCIERWNVQKYTEGYPVYGSKEKAGIMLSCNNATWTSVAAVDHAFAKNFLTGGPMGFSCDLAAFPDSQKALWRDAIAAYKEERTFYQTAAAQILADSDSLTAIAYADEAMDHIVVQVFTKTVYAQSLRIYPMVDKNKRYRFQDEEHSGAEILENGIFVAPLYANSCQVFRLDAI